LAIGNYTVSATAGGFGTTTSTPFQLEIDQIAKVDLKLQVGKATTIVTIGADEAPLLNTENATLGTTISEFTLQSMPLDGLNVYYAVNFVPGAANPSIAAERGLSGAYRTAPGLPAGITSFNGNRQQGNNYVLDGVEVNETIANTIGYTPSSYSVQEMRVITGNADAEYGNVNGGEVIAVTKSGTNRFHGSAFENYQNQNLAANLWDNGRSLPVTPKAIFNQHQFGGAVGGPILRDKLFFFADYLGLRYHVPSSTSEYSVPDQLERNGDFSELLGTSTPVQLYNTTNGNGSAAVPYPDNRGIPTLNPVAKYLFSNQTALPLPNHAPDPGFVTQNNYRGIVTSDHANNQVDGRVDYTLSQKDTVMVKGTWGDAHDSQSQLLPIVFPSANDYPFYMGAVNWVHTISPLLVNEVRVGYSRIVQSNTVADPSRIFGTKGNSLVGIPLSSPQSIVGFTNMAISNSENGGYGTSSGVGAFAADNNFSYGDNLTWVHGRHITKFGVQFVRYQENYYQPGNLGGILGTFSYSGQYTSGVGPTDSDPGAIDGASVGDGFADFELNKAQGGLANTQTGNFGARQWRDA
jgi:hypothetical protein